MATKKNRKPLPKLFVGSDVESLGIAHSLQEHLRETAEVMVWTQDVFTLTDSALAGFQRVLEAADCAIFIVDSFTSKSKSLSPNLLLQLGMSIGFLGEPRTTLLLAGTPLLKLPSDMPGISVYSFTNSENPKKLHSALLSVASKLRLWIRRIGRRGGRAKERAQPTELRQPRLLTGEDAPQRARKKPGHATLYSLAILT